MDNSQILEQLKKEINWSTKCCSEMGRFINERALIVYPHARFDFYLIFCIKNNELVLIKECWTELNLGCKSKNCDIAIGEIDSENIVNMMDLFANYGKANNPKGPSMNKLWNNRYMTIKSARKI